MKCTRCKKREAEFNSPGDWCAECWHQWWFFDDMPKDATDEDIEARRKEYDEALKEFREEEFKRTAN